MFSTKKKKKKSGDPLILDKGKKKKKQEELIDALYDSDSASTTGSDSDSATDQVDENEVNKLFYEVERNSTGSRPTLKRNSAGSRPTLERDSASLDPFDLDDEETKTEAQAYADDGLKNVIDVWSYNNNEVADMKQLKKDRKSAERRRKNRIARHVFQGIGNTLTLGLFGLFRGIKRDVVKKKLLKGLDKKGREKSDADDKHLEDKETADSFEVHYSAEPGGANFYVKNDEKLSWYKRLARWWIGTDRGSVF